jgi:pyruvate kinase
LRAEATDVFNAILDGSDAIMLSDETCDGPYPYQAIETAVNIAVAAEKYYYALEDAQDRYKRIMNKSRVLTLRMIALSEDRKRSAPRRLRKYWSQESRMLKMQTVTDSITESACTLSSCPGVTAIIAPTTTGRTARMISRFRAAGVSIIGAAHDRYNKQKLILSYGVRPIEIGTGFKDSSAVAIAAGLEAQANGLTKRTDHVVVTAGSPLFDPGTTNLVMIKSGAESKRRAKGHRTPL